MRILIYGYCRYGGNYYGLLREMIQEGGFDILGHLDCIRKRNALLHFFDESAPWYKTEIQETAKTIIQKGVIVEINTGGMFRKATQTPYPAFDILSLFSHFLKSYTYLCPISSFFEE